MSWINIPYFANKSRPLSGKYLTVSGGYHSIPNGCPAWGSSIPRRVRFIGDTMGHLALSYADGTVQRIPLVFGYTLWFKSVWQEPVCAPFKTDGGEALSDALKCALFLQGAYEGNETCCLRIQLMDKPLCGVAVEAAEDKEGEPIFDCFTLSDDEAAKDSFFADHTVSGEEIPETVMRAIDQINLALLTPVNGLLTVSVPEAKSCGLNIRFEGRHARIFNGIFHTNAANLMQRTDEDGFIHTSYTGAPSWRYDGFGPWIPNADSYCKDFYARDGARALMTLTRLGRMEHCMRAVAYAQQCLMFFPENHLTLLGKPVPGHFTMVINDPLFFHEQLTKVGWPTQYTPERFGSEYANLGNQETDGHGLMMMAIYNVFKNSPDKAVFANENLKYIKEAAEYIRWSIENSDASLSQNGLLYGEGEATHGTGGYSMYANIPCALGLQGYAEIAETAGDAEAARSMRETAASLRKAITDVLSKDGQWLMSEFGYYHDCAVTFLSDLCGYDINDMPPQWVQLSKNTYEADISRSRHIPYDASGGLGYNTSMRLQNALLLDQTEDYRRFAEDLLCLCYAPGLPEPYLVPECASYSDRLQALRRQGDLANLVQMAEVLKCLLMMIGISPLANGCVKILPRLCENTGYSVTDFPVENSSATISVQASCPANGSQKITVQLKNDGSVHRVLVRFGPFSEQEAQQPEKLKLSLNEQNVAPVLFRSGTAFWSYADVKM